MPFNQMFKAFAKLEKRLTDHYAPCSSYFYLWHCYQLLFVKSSYRVRLLRYNGVVFISNFNIILDIFRIIYKPFVFTTILQ